MSDYLALVMFPALIGLIIAGFPIAFSMILVATLFGIMQFGDAAAYQLLTKIEDTASNSILAAVPLFIFMGAMLERSGIAERLFTAIHFWTRRLPGDWASARWSWGPCSPRPVGWSVPPRR